MSVLQYVGARYVPTFYKNPNGSWDWEAGVSYEPLTIVKYGENSYTSRSQVPATVGSPNLNPDYWANTGNYGGFEMEINNRLSQAESDIENLQQYNRGRNLAHRYFLLIGDSYEERSGWATKLASFIRSCGGRCDIQAVPGAGLTVGTTWAALYNSSPEKGSYTDVLIGGGINDNQATDENITAYMSALSTAIGPANCRIYYCAFGDVWHNVGLRDSAKKVYAKIKALCRTYGISWVENCFGMLYANSMFQSDNLHPNSSGGDWIASCLSNFILTGSNDWEVETTINSSSYMTIKNGIKTFYIGQVLLGRISGKTNVETLIESGALTLLPTCNPTYFQFYLHDSSFVQSSTDGGIPGGIYPVSMVINGNGLKLNVLGSGQQNYNSNVYVYGTPISVPISEF